MVQLTTKIGLIGLMAIALTPSTVASAQAPCIEADLPFSAGSAPLSLAIGDLNGDTFIDLVEVDYSGDTLKVQLNDSSGSFVAGATYSTLAAPYSVSLADLDADGDLDVVVANGGSDSIGVYLNSGGGVLALPVMYQTGFAPRSVAVGDLDGDGDLDIAVANIGDDTISVFKNIGTGAFGVSVSHGAGPGPVSIALADLDGDGALDICVADANTNPGSVSVLLNSGNGSFPSFQTYPAIGISGFSLPRSIVAADFDLDGDLDIAVTLQNAFAVAVLFNQGNGSMLLGGYYSTGAYPLNVCACDANADGFVDILVAEFGPGRVSLFANQGAGNFLLAGSHATGSGPAAIAVGDLDHDGDLDWCTADALSDTISVFRGCALSGSPVCAGDGTGTLCPCGQLGLIGHGCPNSVDPNGGRLVGSGEARIGSDALILTGTGMPTSSALYFQGTALVGGGLGVVFGDGLRCAGGTVIRMGVKTNALGASQYPDVGDQPVSVRGLVGLPGSRIYQVWYRNAAAYCTPSTFNLTNGLSVTWRP